MNERPANEKDATASAASGDAEAKLDQELAGDPMIGQLRALYDQVAAEPLPEPLLELLKKLDDRERNR